MNDLFTIQPTDRRNESYHKLQPIPEKEKLAKVIEVIDACDGLSSRIISKITGIERTTVTRILKENEKLFDTTGEYFDYETNRTVTLYRLNKEV